MQQPTASNPAIAEETLYQHRCCPEWGLAFVAWERDEKRGYQFEDGKLRVFKRGYFDRLVAVDRPIDEQARTLEQLNRHLGRRRAAQRNGTKQAPIALAQQVDCFRARFPKGFQAAAFAQNHRGIDSKRQLKRHRNPAMKLARTLFREDRLRESLATNTTTSLMADFVSLFDSTDLVTKAQSRGFEAITEADAHRLVSALVELMWGEGTLRRRFDKWVSALNRALPKGANWAVASAIPALLAPSERIAIKTSTFKRQAAWMAPNLVIDKAPSGTVYERCHEMARTMTQKLEEEGLKPRDYLDLYDFIQITLSPKAIKQLLERDATTSPTPDAAESATNRSTAVAS